jgi:hypothetical protein
MWGEWQELGRIPGRMERSGMRSGVQGRCALLWVPDRASRVREGGVRHPRCATPRDWWGIEGHGRRAADPNFIYAGHPAPHVRRFLSPASRVFAGPVWHDATSGPLKRTEPRTGRSAGRAGYSAPHLLHARRSTPRAGLDEDTRLQGPPETQDRLVPRRERRSPPAPPGTDRTMPFRWAGTGVM